LEACGWCALAEDKKAEELLYLRRRTRARMSENVGYRGPSVGQGLGPPKRPGPNFILLKKKELTSQALNTR